MRNFSVVDETRIRDYRLRHVTIDGCGISSLPIRAFKNFRVAIIKFRTDAVCCIHVSTILPNQSINQPMSLLFAVHRCQIFRLKCTKFNFGWGFVPDPAGELTALPRPSSWWGGVNLPPHQEPHPRSGLTALPPKPKSETPPMGDIRDSVPGLNIGGEGTCRPVP